MGREYSIRSVAHATAEETIFQGNQPFSPSRSIGDKLFFTRADCLSTRLLTYMNRVGSKQCCFIFSIQQS